MAATLHIGYMHPSLNDPRSGRGGWELGILRNGYNVSVRHEHRLRMCRAFAVTKFFRLQVSFVTGNMGAFASESPVRGIVGFVRPTFQRTKPLRHAVLTDLHDSLPNPTDHVSLSRANKALQFGFR